MVTYIYDWFNLLIYDAIELMLKFAWILYTCHTRSLNHEIIFEGDSKCFLLLNLNWAIKIFVFFCKLCCGIRTGLGDLTCFLVLFTWNKVTQTDYTIKLSESYVVKLYKQKSQDINVQKCVLKIIHYIITR